MARCGDCNKFVSYGDPDTDEIEITADGGSVDLNGTLYLTCGECGGQIASAEMSSSVDLSGLFSHDPDEKKGELSELEINIAPEIEATDRVQDTGRNGKKIKNYRYMKRFYGVSATVTVTQTIVDKEGNAVGTPEEIEVTIEAEEQASGFEPTM